MNQFRPRKAVGISYAFNFFCLDIVFTFRNQNGAVFGTGTPRSARQAPEELTIKTDGHG